MLSTSRLSTVAKTEVDLTNSLFGVSSTHVHTWPMCVGFCMSGISATQRTRSKT